ncbi:selenium metabolism-associated LysR family transcriptional regulator [Garciella nitratireducens]|uniref:DNA-binding transcriptional regulator, LysR family n=1 Tax=Garciella nitratireducens DSM 15102 TaxID=1121911 RepID=A0A1T4LB38_9FIRM|nr:selenium metabolism-associated LysR family transcriptional regulator [Garciella nitratireducens]RBP46733.1 DNA-binding transcriptional LysR family regulator [Garciella nitratireducens]SJZ52032.1 DNA-binding transcriptional regulator, LysR family [Garciella nitratireducens DSM 15102]
MEIRQLQTFVYVVQLKSFSKVAEKLFLTQPTITSHIQSLEKELGIILLNRSSKEITLTKGGQILYEYALNILDLKDKALFSLDAYKGKIKGCLTLAASSIPEQYVLPELILEFRKFYPDVTFDVKHYSSREAIDKIEKYDIEFGMVGTKIEHSKLSFANLMLDQLVLIAPNQWETIQNPLPMEKLVTLPFILREESSGTRIQFEKILKQEGYSVEDLNIICYFQSSEAIKEAVKKGLGVSIVSEKAIEVERKFNLLQIIPLEMKRNFYFVYHKNRALSPLGDTFKKFVLEYLQK